MPLHLLLVHFPVALLVVGAAADLIGAVLRNEGVRRWAGVLLILGAAASVPAMLTGQGAASVLPFDPQVYQRMEVHSQWGGAGLWLLVGAGGLRAAWRGRLQGIHGWISLALAVLSAVLVLAIASSGSAISHRP